MHPEDAQLSRVFTRDVGSTVGDQTFQIGNNFEVVVDAEAGSTIFNNQSQYHTDVVVIDYSQDATFIPGITPAGGFQGAIGQAPWGNNPATQFTWTVPAASLVGRADHMCQAYAFLRVGAGAEPQVSIFVSPFFLLH